MILASMLTPSVLMKVIVRVTYLFCFVLCFLPTHPWASLPCRVFFIITLFGSMEQLHVPSRDSYLVDFACPWPTYFDSTL